MGETAEWAYQNIPCAVLNIDGYFLGSGASNRTDRKLPPPDRI